MKLLSIIILFSVLLLSVPVIAQDQPSDQPEPGTKWEKYLRLRFFLDQIVQDNWTKGGDEAFNWKVEVENDFSREGKKTKWDNQVRAKYSQSNIGSGESLQRRVNLNEIKGRTALIFLQKGHFNPFFGGTFESQIATGYKYFNDKSREARSAFWDPAILTQNLGVDVSGIKFTKLRLSVDYKQRIADKYVQYYKIDNPNTTKIEKIKVEKSTTLWSEYKQQVNERLAVKGLLEANYNFMHYTETDVDFEATIDVKLYSFLNFSLYSQFRYHKDESVRRQFRNTFGLTFIFDLFK